MLRKRMRVRNCRPVGGRSEDETALVFLEPCGSPLCQKYFGWQPLASGHLPPEDHVKHFHACKIKKRTVSPDEVDPSMLRKRRRVCNFAIWFDNHMDVCSGALCCPLRHASQVLDAPPCIAPTSAGPGQVHPLLPLLCTYILPVVC